MRNIKYLLLSVLLHLIFFVDFGPTTPSAGRESSGQYQKISIFEKGRRAGDAGCSNFYGGVGVVTDSNDIVISVPYGYPAYRGGVLVGDKILNQLELRGEPGTKVVVHIERQSVRLPPIHLTRERICADSI